MRETRTSGSVGGPGQVTARVYPTTIGRKVAARWTSPPGDILRPSRTCEVERQVSDQLKKALQLT